MPRRLIEPPRPLHAIHYEGQVLSCWENETLLDALLRRGASIDFSCKSGVCRRCLVKVQEGTAPRRASRSLPGHLQAAGYVLACQCHPEGPLRVAPKAAADNNMLTPCMPKRMGGQAVDAERCDIVTLDDDTVCDHCGAQIPARTTARFHAQLGQVACHRCARG